MRTALYFHGYGSRADGSRTFAAFKEHVPGYDYVAIDAPFDAVLPNHPGETLYKWFSLPSREGPDADARGAAELKESAAFIKNKIAELRIDESELTLIGASQGGFMSLYLTLNKLVVPRRAIAVVPFYSRELIPPDVNKTTPILWINCGRDEKIEAERKSAWTDAIAAGAKVDYYEEPDAGHKPDTYPPSLWNKILEWDKE
jgi:predicted esterase